MVLRCSFGHNESFRDLPVGEALCNQGGDVTLTIRE